MARRGTLHSPSTRGRALVWLAIVCSVLAALWVIYASASSGDNPRAVWVAVLLTETILLYGAIRRRSFARWGLVIALLGAGAVPVALTFGLIFVTSFSREDLSADYLIYPAAVLCWISAATLAFSEAVGDYFAFRQTHLAPEQWGALPLPPAEQWVRDGIPGSALLLAGSPDVAADDLGAELRQRSTEVKRIRFAVLSIFVLMCVLALASATVIGISLRHSTEQAQNEANAANSFVINVLMVVYLLGSIVEFGLAIGGVYLVFFALPFLLTLPFSFSFAKRWQDPARFLLLRPFGTPQITPSLRRYLQREVVPFGHCYTLADSAIHIPWYIRAPFFLGQLALFSFRTRKLRSPRDLQRLAREMNRRVMRNLNWLLSRNRLFAITCSDFAWQPCVKAVVERADVILMDVTVITPNMLWELNLLRATEASSRTILLKHDASQPASQDDLFSGVPIVIYGSDGVRGAGTLAAAVTKILLETRYPRSLPLP